MATRKRSKRKTKADLKVGDCVGVYFGPGQPNGVAYVLAPPRPDYRDMTEWDPNPHWVRGMPPHLRTVPRRTVIQGGRHHSKPVVPLMIWQDGSGRSRVWRLELMSITSVRLQPGTVSCAASQAVQQAATRNANQNAFDRAQHLRKVFGRIFGSEVGVHATARGQKILGHVTLDLDQAELLLRELLSRELVAQVLLEVD